MMRAFQWWLWIVFAVLLQQADGFAATIAVSSTTSSSTLHSAAVSSASASAASSSVSQNLLVPETRPLAPHTFAGMVEKAIIERFGHDVDRVLTSWRLLDQEYVHRAFVGAPDDDDDVEDHGRDVETSSHCYQEAHSYVPGLTTREFWNTSNFAWCHELEEKYPLIRQEFIAVNANRQSLQERGNNVWAGALTADAAAYGQGWQTLVLMNRGMWDPVNVNLFPVTSQIIRDVMGKTSSSTTMTDDSSSAASSFYPVEIFFASMQPQSTIQWHSDNTNFVLTSHLGLQIPGTNDECRLKVGDTEVSWRNGQVLLFDTSILHQACNECENDVRYILMFRVYHPDLTDVERQALQFIYNVLEFPQLLSTDATERQQAEQALQVALAFPTIMINDNNKTGRKTGFGVGVAAAGGAGKSKPRKKR
jgi:aspartyl/asparaginyl beta-hydroxylase (cupin superfamily)